MHTTTTETETQIRANHVFTKDASQRDRKSLKDTRFSIFTVSGV